MQFIRNILETFENVQCWQTLSKVYNFQIVIQGVILLTVRFAFSLVQSQNMTADRTNFSHWMESLPLRFHNIPLTDLAIPGSHDSCSYSLSPRSSYSIGLNSEVKDIISSMDVATGRDLVYRWSVTQAQTVEQQLESGIRYLDIRISYNRSQEEIYVAHGLVGAKLDEILMQVKNFLRKFTKEVVILDFNHIYTLPGDKHTVFNLLFFKIKHHLASYLCPRTRLSRITLRHLWRSGKRVLVFVDASKTERLPEFAWRSSVNILAPFDTRTFEDPDKWIAFLTAEYRAKRPRNMFYVTQGILLPHWLEMLAGQAVNATLKAWISQTASARLVKWIKRRKGGHSGINIVIADYIEESDFVPTVLYLNGSGRTPLRMRVYVIMLLMYIFSV